MANQMPDTITRHDVAATPLSARRRSWLVPSPIVLLVTVVGPLLVYVAGFLLTYRWTGSEAAAGLVVAALFVVNPAVFLTLSGWQLAVARRRGASLVGYVLALAAAGVWAVVGLTLALFLVLTL